ncbi:PREDICTED: uncharacterized protein LOC107172480 [Diuraphis noxia]|uniref:uncharacterized protein LOC107172480 n=1 Tax=Diuraphis noxia TaxID=143948 RepID=UPI0007635AB3|nr:PREDICTED: uncharacterized protein LOC107172480 [Diuraphis noxia]
MDSQNNHHNHCPGQKLITGNHVINGIREMLPQSNRTELTIEKQNKLTTFRRHMTRNAPARSYMSSLPCPPKHRTNNAWKKPPPIPKLTLQTESTIIKLNWDDGISSGSYYRYEAIAGYELFACVLEDRANEVKWEYLTFLAELSPSFGQRQSITCEMKDLVIGFEYYFAVRSVDVHERRGPCAVVYTLL